MSGSFEPHTAVGAVEEFLVRVDVLMLLVVAEAGETFATVRADVRPFFGVLLLVILQLKVVSKCFGTLGTLQGFARLVCEHVNLQLSRWNKQFSIVWLFSGNWKMFGLRERKEKFLT